MPDAASINRSISTIRTELSYLREAGILTQQQHDSIQAQLPQNGDSGPSTYTDPSYGQQFQQAYHPAQVAQQAQDPGQPANPQHPKHHEWLSNFARQMGNAAVFGAGATAGSDLVNAAFRKF